MPKNKYDRLFGGKGGASKAKSAMAKEYGDKKGEQVFYATMNKRKKGVIKAAAHMARGRKS